MNAYHYHCGGPMWGPGGTPGYCWTCGERIIPTAPQRNSGLKPRRLGQAFERSLMQMPPTEVIALHHAVIRVRELRCV